MQTSDFEFPWNPMDPSNKIQFSVHNWYSKEFILYRLQEMNLYTGGFEFNPQYQSVGAYFQKISDEELARIKTTEELTWVSRLLMHGEGWVAPTDEEEFDTCANINDLLLIEQVSRIRSYQPLRCNYSCLPNNKPILKDWSVIRIKEFIKNNDSVAISCLFDILCK